MSDQLYNTVLYPTDQQLERLRFRYHLYLDETGNAQFSSKRAYPDANSRYLTIAGLSIRGDIYWTHIVPAVRELKEKYFGDPDALLHYTDLFIARRESVLRVDQREDFWADFLDILCKTPCTLLSITVDKQRMQNQYREWLWDPYHLIMAWHVERLMYALARTEQQESGLRTGGFSLRAKVVVEARGGSQRVDSRGMLVETGPDRSLSNSYRRVYHEGVAIHRRIGLRSVTAKEVQGRLVSNEIAIIKKEANNIGLQLADMICFPMHWNTLIELSSEDLLQMGHTAIKHPNVALLWSVLHHRIAKDEKGSLIGWGIKLFPEKDLLT